MKYVYDTQTTQLRVNTATDKLYKGSTLGALN